MKEELKYVLDKMFHLVQFAEAKNGGLLAINVGILSYLITLFKDKINEKHEWLIMLSLFFFFTSFVILLFSQYPKISLNIKKQKKKIPENIFFFHDLANTNIALCIKKLKKMFPVEKISYVEENLCEEIIINAQIASFKFRQFKKAFFMFILGIISLIIFSGLNY